MSATTWDPYVYVSNDPVGSSSPDGRARVRSVRLGGERAGAALGINVFGAGADARLIEGVFPSCGANDEPLVSAADNAGNPGESVCNDCADCQNKCVDCMKRCLERQCQYAPKKMRCKIDEQQTCVNMCLEQ